MVVVAVAIVTVLIMVIILLLVRWVARASKRGSCPSSQDSQASSRPRSGDFSLRIQLYQENLGAELEGRKLSGTCTYRPACKTTE